MSTLEKSIETVEIWLDMWSDEQAELDEVEEGDLQEREVIKAMREILQQVKPKKLEACPHAAPHNYCIGCVVSPCPIGLKS